MYGWRNDITPPYVTSSTSHTLRARYSQHFLHLYPFYQHQLSEYPLFKRKGQPGMNSGRLIYKHNYELLNHIFSEVQDRLSFYFTQLN